MQSDSSIRRPSHVIGRVAQSLTRQIHPIHNPGRRMLLSIAACLLYLPVLSAVETYQPKFADPVVQPWRWRAFPELNGKGFQCMAEARDKAMWFGLDEGAMRYDGLYWRYFTARDGLKGAPVTALHGARDGTVYAGTSNGIYRFADNQWKRIFPTQAEAPLTTGGIIESSDGAIWATMDKGALRIGGGEMILYASTRDAAALKRSSPDLRIIEVPRGEDFDFFSAYEDRQRKLWFGVNLGGSNGGGALLVLDRSGSNSTPSWQWHLRSADLDVGRRPLVLEDRDGTLWTVNAISRNKCSRFDGKKWITFSLNDVGGTDIDTSLLATSDGALWIGGFKKLHIRKDGEWLVYQTPVAPVPPVRISLLAASDGSIWVGGEKDEVFRFDYSPARWATYKDLNFHGETPDGRQWFLEWDGSVVVRAGNQWSKYTSSDGIIDGASRLLPTKSGRVWAVGSHKKTAAVACFDGRKWTRMLFPRVSWGFTNRAAFEARDGSVWFGSDSPIDASKGEKGGVVQYSPSAGAPDNPAAWTHIDAPALSAVIFIGQTGDGTVWLGDKSLFAWRGGKLERVTDPKELVLAGAFEYSESSPDGDLWLATRGYGAMHLRDGKWTRYGVENGLPSNCVGSLLVAKDKSVWLGTLKGISRFDGARWTTTVLPSDIRIEPQNGWLIQSSDGAIWVNNSYREWVRRGLDSVAVKRDRYIEHQTMRFKWDDQPPRTAINVYQESVSQPGNVILSWTGSDPWQVTRNEDLQYSYRMDKGPWSPFAAETSHIFLAVPSGRHSFEVRSRDQDFNIDPSPARVEFRVVPPIWLQPWFLATLSLLLGVIVYLVRHIILKAKHLEDSNRAITAAGAEIRKQASELASANERMNHELAERERAEQSVRQNEGRIRSLYSQMKGAVVELEQAVREISAMAEQVTAAAGEISRGSEVVAGGASQQASALEEISASLRMMTDLTSRNRDHARMAKQLVEGTTKGTRKGLEEMKQLSQAMAEIKGAANQTGEVVKTIDAIAFQTNLLALNAAIEAARAGESGRGFAVVADEVRRLAMRSADATRNSARLIQGAIEKAEDGVRLNEKVLTALHANVSEVDKVRQFMAEIADLLEQQTQGILQIDAGLDQTNQVTQNNAAASRQSASAGQEVFQSAERMRQLVRVFQSAMERLISPERSRSMTAGAPQLATDGNNGGNARMSSNTPRICQLSSPRQSSPTLRR